MILNRIRGMHNELVAWRQKLHTIPELGFDTAETANFVKEKLEEFGVDEIECGLAKNGVVALIHGKNKGHSIGLRADMDALPITEVNDLPHKSKNEAKTYEKLENWSSPHTLSWRLKRQRHLSQNWWVCKEVE